LRSTNRSVDATIVAQIDPIGTENNTTGPKTSRRKASLGQKTLFKDVFGYVRQPPIYGGRTGYGVTSLSLLESTSQLIEEVVTFQTVVRDYSAPRMSLASSLPAVPLAELRPTIDVQA
jgi:hypothetical protein